MQKKSSTLVSTLLIALLVFAVGLLLERSIQQNLESKLTKEYLVQEETFAEQIAMTLENEVMDVTDKLYLIAGMQEIQSGSPQVCNAKLQEILSEQSKLGNLGRVNAQGNFSCSINKSLIGVPAAKLGPYINDIFKDPSHKAVVSNAFIPPGSKDYIIAIHVPVYTDQNKFDGTVDGAIYLKDFSEKYLSKVKFAKTGFAVLYDQNGDVLYHPKTGFIGKNLSSPELKKAFGNIDQLEKMVTNGKNGGSGTVNYSIEGVEKIGTYKPVDVSSGHRWIVLVTVPVDAASVALDDLGINQSFTMLASILGAAILLVALALLVGMFRSINLQQKLDKQNAALAVEKARAQTLLESIGDGVIAIDLNWNITMFNKTSAELTGWQVEEAIGRPLRKVLPLIRQHDRAEDYEFIEEAVNRGKVRHMTSDMVLIKRNKTEIAVGDSVAPIFDGQKKVAGAVIVFRDIAKEKEAGRMKSDFAYASHQFRTPLSQVRSALSLAMTETSLPSIKEDLKMATIGINSIHKLTTNMLEMSEIENKRLVAKPVIVSVTDLVAKVTKALEAEFLKKQLKLKTDVSKDTETLTSDPDLLERVIVELLQNSINYSDSGTTVELNFSRRDTNAVLSVSNHGEPILEEELPLIYTKYFRGTNKPSDVSGGGLGLYLVREYVKLLEGKVWFISSKKETVFSVSLPLK